MGGEVGPVGEGAGLMDWGRVCLGGVVLGEVVWLGWFGRGPWVW